MISKGHLGSVSKPSTILLTRVAIVEGHNSRALLTQGRKP